jgi:hypothetical protein
VGHVAHIGEMKNTYKIVVGECKGKRPLGGTRSRWMYKIKVNRKEKVEGVG